MWDCKFDESLSGLRFHKNLNSQANLGELWGHQKYILVSKWDCLFKILKCKLNYQKIVLDWDTNFIFYVKFSDTIKTSEDI